MNMDLEKLSNELFKAKETVGKLTPKARRFLKDIEKAESTEDLAKYSSAELRLILTEIRDYNYNVGWETRNFLARLSMVKPLVTQIEEVF